MLADPRQSKSALSQDKVHRIALVAAVVFILIRFFPPLSADFMALWLAGNFLGMGQPDLVYPSDTTFFTMLPPDGWRELAMERLGYDGPIYPFLYPPIWARFGQLLSGFDFYLLVIPLAFINACLLVGCIELARRIVRPAMPPAAFTLLALFMLIYSDIGSIAVMQSQPQILVSFLLLLTVERDLAKAPRAAGIALAFAAAIKLYPAAFALFWIFSRNREALLAFAASGALLGLTSIAVAGWPLHADFLEQTGKISGGVLLTSISFNVDAAVSQICCMDMLQRFDALEDVGGASAETGWYAMVKPSLWRIASLAAVVAAMLALARLYATSPENLRARAVWPLAMLALPLLSPIGWAYYYIPALCLAPALFSLCPRKKALAILAVCFAPLFLPFLHYYRQLAEIMDTSLILYQLAGTAGLSVLALVFLHAALTKRLD